MIRGTSPYDSPVSTLDEEDIRQLLPVATQESFEPGAILLRFGQADVDLFVIVSGEVEVLNPTDGNSRIACRGPGDFVGDIDLITRRPIVYGVRALGDDSGGPTHVLRVKGERVRELLNSAPHFGEKLIAAFLGRRELLEGTGALGLRVLGQNGCVHTHRLREFLHKNFVPYGWIDSDSPAGGAALTKLGSPVRMPAVDLGDGRVILQPSLKELAAAAGVWRECPDQDVEFAIVGAGPAGIAAAVYAASEGLRTIVLDRLGPGGQIGASSRIENFIGFPAGLSGTDLATRGVLQMLRFGAEMFAPVAVDRFVPATAANDLHEVHLDCGTRVRARTVLACTGVSWRRLPAANARRFERSGVYYTCTTVESRLYEHCDVAVVGAGNSAGQAAMFLADRHSDRTVHLLVRRTLGSSMSEYLVDRIRRTPNVALYERVEVESLEGDAHLQAAKLLCRETGDRSILLVGAVFVFIGSNPHTDWLPASVARDKHGFVMTGADVIAAGLWTLTDRPPFPLESSIPGLLAGGDLRAGSTKRVGFAVGDGSLAVTCAHHLRELANRLAPSGAFSAVRLG